MIEIIRIKTERFIPTPSTGPTPGGTACCKPFTARCVTRLVGGSIAHMIGGAKLDVIHVRRLTSTLSTEAGSAKLTRRFAWANAAKSVVTCHDPHAVSRPFFQRRKSTARTRQVSLVRVDHLLGGQLTQRGPSPAGFLNLELGMGAKRLVRHKNQRSVRWDLEEDFSCGYSVFRCRSSFCWPCSGTTRRKRRALCHFFSVWTRLSPGDELGLRF
jgi:hypothetical protein